MRTRLSRRVPGWLRPEDALKLYELAYYATGPILEIGTYRGKSGTLMAIAARARRPGGPRRLARRRSRGPAGGGRRGRGEGSP
jgi:predicted O-methyltransferase YrrM